MTSVAFHFAPWQDGRALFSELIALAEEQPPKNLKEASFRIGHRMDLHRFIVPVQARWGGLTIAAMLAEYRCFISPTALCLHVLPKLTRQ